MKKHLFFLLSAIVAGSSVCQAQNSQTYQGTQAFNTMIGYISGTEKYSYVIDSYGEKLYQGAYSFSGDKSLSSNTAQISGKYTINTNFTNHKLNGTYTASASYSGKNWTYTRGWQAYTASTKLTATFANGKPNGTFTATYKGDANFSGNATLKNGKYIGAYSYSGPGHNSSLWEIKGQLSSDGKLTGNWIVQNIVTDWKVNYTFLNDVLIGGGNMTPQIQNISKQFAEGKISEKEIVKKGYVIANNSLPLQLYIDYLILIDDDYGLNKLGGWDFSDYGPKTFKQILLVNAFTDEGFNYFCEAYRSKTNPHGIYTPQRDLICEFIYTKHDDGLISFKCNKEFAKQHGTHPELAEKDTYYQYIYLTASQVAKYENVLENEAIANCTKEIIPGLSNYKKDKIKAENTITYGTAINANDLTLTTEDLKLYKQYDKYLNQINTQDAYTYRFSSDSSYIFKKHFTGSIEEAINMDIEGVEEYFEWLQQQYNRAVICKNKYQILLKKQESIQEVNESTDNTISKLIKSEVLNECNRSDIPLLKMEELIDKGINMLDLNDSARRKSNILEAKLPKKAYKFYQKQERDARKCNQIESLDQLINNFTLLNGIQDKFLNHIQQLENSKALNETIAEKCGESYTDILKSWNAKYKSGIILTEDVDKSLADINDLQNIGQGLLTYISLRLQCDNNSTTIISMCGKTYGDILKPYQVKMKGMTFVPDMTSVEALNKDYNTLSEYAKYQTELQEYIQNRQKVDQLNQSIIEKIGKAKNVKRLYGVLYKSLPITWSAEGDNFKTIEETVSLLQKLETILQSKGADIFDGQLKKAKTADDFKKTLGL